MFRCGKVSRSGASTVQGSLLPVVPERRDVLHRASESTSWVRRQRDRGHLCKRVSVILMKGTDRAGPAGMSSMARCGLALLCGDTGLVQVTS